ncbi:MAG: 4Fe-4S dicluster domain-containing protein [Eubacteriales bacterium]|nr:4Fe-4S dicluster domain-containing protein [Eubacteriales bacterium]
MKKIAMASLNALFARIAADKKLYLPIEKAGKVDFYEWSEGENVRLDALKTVKSAKDVFFPQVENLLKFRVEGKSIEINQAPLCEDDFVIFGVRGCDAKSFEILDRVFLVDPRDEFYASRRAHGIVVTLACGEPEESCFCTNFGVNPANPGGDVTAWIVGEEMLLQANTEKGEKLIAELDEADAKAAEDEQARISEIVGKLPLNNLNLEGFDGAHLMEKFNDPKWEGLSRACLGCGTCTFVCPTCQCYDIRDFDNGKSVTRYRCWDSCMYSDFTLMAAENSRHTQLQRYRQRFMHKLVYFPANNEGVYSCVGCGRCVEKCPQGLNIVRVIKALGVNEK